MEQRPPTAGHRVDSTNINLYCLECGYNLRGLSGDPRRCPECGHLNPMGDLEIPAELITAQLRKMETAPAVCVAAASMLLVVPFLFLALPGGSLGEPSSMFWCVAISLVGAAPFAWFANLSAFRSYCLNKPGWRRALILYHVYGLSLVACMAGIVVLEFWVYEKSAQLRIYPETVVWLSLFTFFAVAGLGGWWAWRRVWLLLGPLQREVAVTLAREELRRRLRGGY